MRGAVRQQSGLLAVQHWEKSTKCAASTVFALSSGMIAAAISLFSHAVIVTIKMKRKVYANFEDIIASCKTFLSMCATRYKP